ncbi:MAG: ABC transporter substrate-binding protein, partial [Vicinamibacteria bacterium]
MLRFKIPYRHEAGGAETLSLRHLCLRAVVLVGALVSAHQAVAAETLVFGSPNPRGLNIGMAPFFYAMELGYFEQEGIELEFVNFDGGAILDPQIATKAVDIGWPGPDSLVISHQKGKDPLPYKYFYNHLRRYVWEIVVPEASPIKTVADLKGAKIGVNSLTTTNIPTTRSIIASAGLDPERDVSYVPVGMGGSAFNAIQTDRIDA